MESALNQWLEKVEDQINQIDDRVNQKASFYEVKDLEKKMQEESDERQQTTEQILQIAQNAEKICNRLTDDAF